MRPTPIDRSSRRLLTAALVLVITTGASAPRFRLPGDNAGGEAIWTLWVIGVDHSEEVSADPARCVDYQGRSDFPHCYAGHRGTDYMLKGGFDAMDDGSAAVVAAADGVVRFVVDGHYDRCRGNWATGDIDCDGHEQRSNTVIITHEGGVETIYAHFMKNSIMVEEGQVVRCGEELGLIGSSGISAAPHLHFEVRGPGGEVIDPYAGPLSRPESYWVEQYADFGLPAELCEGEEPPAPDPAPDPDYSDVAEPGAPDIGRPDVAEPDTHSVVEPTVPDATTAPETFRGDDIATWEVAQGGDLSAREVLQTPGEPAPPKTRLPMGCQAAPGGGFMGGVALLLLPLLIALAFRSGGTRPARNGADGDGAGGENHHIARS